MIYVLGGTSKTTMIDTVLNYNVVGGTSAPSNPTENTIWVNTSNTVHAHAFSNTEPHRVSNNKNLIVYPFYQTTKTEAGITWTDNGDGTVKANGTTTDTESYFRPSNKSIATHEFILQPGTYHLSGCPSGGSNSTYVLQVGYSGNNWDGVTWANDVGEGITFTITKEVKARCVLAIRKNTTVSNLVFKPQLERGSSATSFLKGDATGQVWIQTGNYSPVEFDALKDNEIQIIPINTKQYISGAWVNKTAKTYQSGAWKDWVIYLYNTGDKCESLHGGWTTSTRWHATNAKTPYITYNEDTMLVGVTGSGKNFQSGILETVDGVDLTNYSKLTFVVTKTEASQAFDDGWVRVYIGTTANLSGNVTANVEKYIDRPGTYTLDISSLSGVHDIIVKVVCAGNTSSYTRVTFSQIYLSN